MELVISCGEPFRARGDMYRQSSYMEEDETAREEVLHEADPNPNPNPNPNLNRT